MKTVCVKRRNILGVPSLLLCCGNIHYADVTVLLTIKPYVIPVPLSIFLQADHYLVMPAII